MIIDGREVPVEPGATILDVEHRAGIAVPTLCHHPALPPDGCWRMCLVEIAPGTVFVPFHFAEAAANVLTHAALDPVAKIPEYKVCAVAAESVSAPAAGPSGRGGRG